MDYIVNYRVQNRMRALPLSAISLDGEIGKRFDRFVYERVSGGFAIKEILREAQTCFSDKYDDEYGAGMWRGEFWGKLILSAVRVAQMKGDAALKADIAASVHELLKYQREDGYLSTYQDISNAFGSNTADPTFTLIGWDTNWNIWSQKYTLWALIESAMLLDDENILRAAERMADNIISTVRSLGVKVVELGVMHGMPAGSIMKPMLLLYRLCGKRDYLDFAADIAKEWDRADGKCPNLIANSINGIPPCAWYDPNGGWLAKAYEMMSCFDGICELYRITGEERLLLAAERFWEQLQKTEANILGSVGYCERFVNAAAYPDSATEVCDAIHWMRLSYELFIITEKPRYIDAFERAFLNAFLAGVYEDGKWGAFFVRSAGRHWSAEPQCESRHQHCCVNNAPRGYANAAQTVITESDDGYYINSYIQSTVRLGDVSFRIGTGYLDRGWLAITVRGLKPGTRIYLRAPEWSAKTDATVMATGELIELKRGAYTPVSVSSEHSVIKLVFDMTPRVIPFGGEFKQLPDTDYHVLRWVDGHKGPCNREAMLKAPMCTVERGPLVLARSKRIGSEQSDMFSGETVFGRTVVCEAASTRHDNLLTLCYVTLKTSDGTERTYTMCDYASAANSEIYDPRYFTVYV